MSPAAVSEALRQTILAEGHWHCGYCLSAEILTGIPLTLDHLIPVAAGGPATQDNLWPACRPCNENKGAQTQALDPLTGRLATIFNPRTQLWQEHFRWEEDGARMVGLTATGRATVAAKPAIAGQNAPPLDPRGLAPTARRRGVTSSLARPALRRAFSPVTPSAMRRSGSSPKPTAAPPPCSCRLTISLSAACSYAIL